MQDAGAVLRAQRDPARYVAFLDSAPDANDPEPAPPQNAAEDADAAPGRNLDGVAAALAAAINAGATEPTSEPTPEPTPEDGEDSTHEEATDAAAGEEPTPEPPVPPPATTEAVTGRARQPLLLPPSSIARSTAGRPDAQLEARYLAHSADLTLSGGLATALAAPLGVCALAEHYVFRHIGGASAGAASAAATAAAELGRTVAADDPAHVAPVDVDADDATTVRPGFAGLADAMAWLAAAAPAGGRERWRLARLFPPGPLTADLHRLVTAGAGPRRRTPRWLRLLAAALAGLDRVTWSVIALLWLGALLGCGGTVLALARSAEVSDSLVPVAAVPLAITFGLAAAFGTVLIGLHTVRLAVRDALDGEGWGLVPGVATTEPDPTRGGADGPDGAPELGRLERVAGVLAAGGVPAVATWVADRIDDLAGVPAGVARADEGRYALTFGDLWLGRLGRRTPADLALLRRAAVDTSLRHVDLTLVATDLSRGRPHLLPFGTARRPEELRTGGYLLCRECLVELLPARVADQMVLLSPGQPDGSPDCPRHDGEALHRLPEPWDLPVAFAVRLAIATPGLLQAVPLYRMTGQASGQVAVHWFCDGAVTGGLPAHTFDVPLPRWPTFSIAVEAGGAADPLNPPAKGATGDPDAWVDVPEQDAAEHQEPWRPVHGAAGLAGAVVAAAGGWRDRMRVQAPGLRGRLAVVRAEASVGPYLPAEAILRLAVRGHHAGLTLRERFTGPDGDDADGQTQTDRYRWVRLRSALTEYRQSSLAIGARIPLYTDLALKYRVPQPLTSWFSPALAPGSSDPAWGDAVAAVTHLRSLAEGGVLDWDTDWGAPPPDPELRLG